MKILCLQSCFEKTLLGTPGGARTTGALMVPQTLSEHLEDPSLKSGVEIGVHGFLDFCQNGGLGVQIIQPKLSKLGVPFDA